MTPTSLDFDHVDLLIGTVESAEDANAKAVRSTVLTPRFYTTDFAALDRLDFSSVRAEWDAMMQEYEGDNNHDHFQRDAAFADEVRQLMPQLSPELRQEFLDFLISSLTSEFSGCILYNEIRKNVSNPDVKQLMTYMARDESRHAGFINQSLKDFNLGIDLGSLKKTKSYTFFKPKYIYYATYLSEKIGYARYITIFRQLERHPDKRFHPIFRWFERWCNDEFRHGESFALMMRAHPHLLQGINLLWIRFFTLAVYATMYVRDHTRPLMHEAMGLDSTGYDYEVFRITSDISRQVFPVEVDIDHPVFRACMSRLVEIAVADAKAKQQGGVWGHLRHGWCVAQAVVTFTRLFFVPVKRRALPQDMRVQPTW
jgi:magnesium-protoporphyrin IX monomethyl ester (oxidative) cyclase